jgi:hypothetical protein
VPDGNSGRQTGFNDHQISLVSEFVRATGAQIPMCIETAI